MNTRKNQLRSLFGGPAAGEGADASGTPDAATPPSASPSGPPQKRATSGAVKAMGLSLNALSQEVDDARRLRESLARGEQVVELDTAVIERSPFLDRLSEGAQGDGSFVELKQSIAEHGQQVPVLVRPHADPAKAAQGIYQIAYGHRRAQAARELGRPVRAVVRSLDDSELAVAQGKENAERRALSFIERAFFAKTLLDHGFERATAQAALAVHKSEMSRLLQVAEMIPEHVARAIGPAPKAGRPRWLALGELLANKRVAHWADETITDASFRECADSDTRFQMIFDRLLSSRDSISGIPPALEAIKAADGTPLADLSRKGKHARFTLASGAGDGFATYLARQLPALHAQFLRERGDKGPGEGGASSG